MDPVMSQPVVSVLIPTYNRAHCICNAIDSVLAQTFTNVEIVVVDDGSKDETPEVMAREYQHEPRVRYLRQQNGGVSAARNHGLRHCRGEFVAFLDSDDVWLPWKLELQVACFRRFPDAVLTWTDMQAINAAGDVTCERYLPKMYRAYRWFTKNDLFTESVPLDELCPGLADMVGPLRAWKGEIYSQMIMGNLVHTSTVMDRRDIVQQVGWFDEKLRRGGEDYDFHIRACKLGPVVFVDAPLIKYQTGVADQITVYAESVNMAMPYLHTITRELRANRDKIHLPRRMIDAALASAHSWIGEGLMEVGKKYEARDHLWRSIRLDPRGSRKYVLLLKAILPGGMEECLRKLYRSARGEKTATLSV
jgi:glycosyltransferase involved in cell wall biosynthesis